MFVYWFVYFENIQLKIVCILAAYLVIIVSVYNNNLEMAVDTNQIFSVHNNTCT